MVGHDAVSPLFESIFVVPLQRDSAFAWTRPV